MQMICRFRKERELLYRSAQKKLKLPGLQNKIANLLGDIGIKSFLSLSETDEIVEQALRNNFFYHEEFAFSSLNDTWRYIEGKMQETDCYLLVDTDWQYCGAIVVDKEFRLSDDFNFDDVVCDELRFFSREGDKVATVDFSNSINDDTYTCSYTEYEK
ncbi:hypothetical protein [Siccibacter colletis]|uniref:hypothetical protein n=1 Tax=Siccibacter colletis TaxID=1505757 RepID=UPI001268EA00|nr:hypothetical protein [Siccibacter colletis]